jgi:hypothetical protein
MNQNEFNIFCTQVFSNWKEFGKESSEFREGIHNFITSEVFTTENYKSILKGIFPSEATAGEDVILWKFLHPIKNGFYIDVGAAHPKQQNVTRYFYDRGWYGINIDPRPECIDLYLAQRPRDFNYCCAISRSHFIIP